MRCAASGFPVRPFIPALAFVALAGCFDGVSPDQLSCRKDEYCPDGYVCIGAQAGTPGRCQRPIDAGRADATTFLADSSSGPDDLGNVDGLAPRIDGSATMVDIPVATDLTPADSPAPPDLGPDYPPDLPFSPLDTLADHPASLPDRPSVPDLASDLRPAGPEVAPDLPYGPEVKPDLPPPSCLIGGTTYASGAANPTNPCQLCKPATPSSWSNADEGTPCNGGQYCNAGMCKAGCFIAGAYYGNGATNPSNACQICRTSSTTDWSKNTDGTSWIIAV